jgi:phosphoenolpyruvate carboxykinase (ATP)
LPLCITGWSGGPYGVGQRLDIAHTRALVHAALDGSLSKAPTATLPLFGLAVPTACPGAPAEILTPRNTWSDKAAYDAQARKLAGMFAENFRTFADQVSPEVRQAGPQTMESLASKSKTMISFRQEAG